jgi:CheY-like chemotaxis protein
MSGGQASARTVLYIEDDPANIHLVHRILSRRPEVVLIVATSGQEGLELAARHEPDLVLLDFHLPDMDGVQILRRLRNQPALASVRVVGISGSGAGTPPEPLREMGVVQVLPKPYDVATFLGVIDNLASDQRVESPRPAPDVQQVLDDRQISRLRELYGASGAMPMLVQTFLQRAVEQIDQMSSAVANGDRHEVEQLAHSLRGSSASLGALRFAETCAQLETLADDGTVESLADLADRAREESVVLGAALVQEFPQ